MRPDQINVTPNVTHAGKPVWFLTALIHGTTTFIASFWSLLEALNARERYIERHPHHWQDDLEEDDPTLQQWEETIKGTVSHSGTRKE